MLIFTKKIFANSLLNIKLYNAILTISVVLFISCGTNRNLNTSNILLESNPKIIFLNYSIQKGSNGNRKIQFINKKIVDGKLKKESNPSIENGTLGDLVFTELDKKSKVLNQILFKNPLVKNIEYVDESKNFKTKTLKSDKTQFSIRLQLKSSTKYITISNFAENEHLIKTQIK